MKLWTKGGQAVDWSEEAVNALYAEIGSRVRRTRKQQGWSQADLGRVVDLTRSSIANLEAGRQRPPVHIILLIAQTLGVSVDTLLPCGDELDKLVKVPSPQLDLEGQPSSTHEFVTTAIRRAAGG
jgi:transcriptional regulator with XRE-family HTH domain